MGFQRRLQLLMACAVVAAALVWLRVAWLQGVQGAHWEAVAARGRLSEVEQVARRGPILDADGRLLVHDMPVQELVLVPSEWTTRERYRCQACGTIHFRATPPRKGSGPPPRPRCCRDPEKRLEALGPGSTAAVERALGLPQGEIAVRAARRLAEIQDQVAAYRRQLREVEELDEDDFLFEDRVRSFEENRTSLPVVLAPEVGQEVARLVGLDELGEMRGLRLRDAHVRVAIDAGPLARVLGEATLPTAEDLARARAARTTLELDVPLGRSGLERTYDDRLRGRAGRELRARGDGAGEGSVLESEPAQPGAALRLSASLEACQAAQRCLESLPNLQAEYAPRTLPSGALIAMRADTGAIVALAELPAWVAPNQRRPWLPAKSRARVTAAKDLANHDWVPARVAYGSPLPEEEQRREVARSSGFGRLLLPWRLRSTELVPWDPPPEGFDRDAWRASLAEPGGVHLSRISQIAVEPGSTMKAFIGLAMLESGLPLPIQVPFACEGERGQPGCHNHGAVDFEAALETSCNQYFATSLRDFKPTHWPTYRRSVAAFIDRLGFGQPTGSDLMGESRGVWLRRERWQPGESPEIHPDHGQQVAIGQGPVTATPLQLVRAVAVLANGGRLVTPHLVEQIQRPGQPASGEPFPVLDLGLDPAHVARVREGMRRVVYGGGGTATKNYDWGGVAARVYGKTGTAQVAPSWRPFKPGSNARGVSHQWFVGWAEAQGRPPLAFAVVYHAREETAAGATAAKTAGAFLQWWFSR